MDGAPDGATDGTAVGAIDGAADGALLGPYVDGALLGGYVSPAFVGANVLGDPVGTFVWGPHLGGYRPKFRIPCHVAHPFRVVAFGLFDSASGVQDDCEHPSWQYPHGTAAHEAHIRGIWKHSTNGAFSTTKERGIWASSLAMIAALLEFA